MCLNRYDGTVSHPVPESSSASQLQRESSPLSFSVLLFFQISSINPKLQLKYEIAFFLLTPSATYNSSVYTSHLLLCLSCLLVFLVFLSPSSLVVSWHVKTCRGGGQREERQEGGPVAVSILRLAGGRGYLGPRVSHGAKCFLNLSLNISDTV